MSLMMMLGLAFAEDTKAVSRVEADAVGGTSWALVIGVDDYQDDGLADLKYPVADATAVAERLRSSPQFDDKHVLLLVPGGEREPTRANIFDALGRLQDATDEGDQVVFYFSGHGLGSRTGDDGAANLLLPVDARLNSPIRTSVAMDDVFVELEKIPASRRVVLVDACRNELAAGAKGTGSSWGDTRYDLTEGTATLYSTAFGKFSYEDDEAGLGVFTRYLLQGLDGEADGQGDADGVVSVDELFEFVSGAVRDHTLEHSSGVQKPWYRVESGGGAFALTTVPGTDLEDAWSEPEASAQQDAGLPNTESPVPAATDSEFMVELREIMVEVEEDPEANQPVLHVEPEEEVAESVVIVLEDDSDAEPGEPETVQNETPAEEDPPEEEPSRAEMWATLAMVSATALETALVDIQDEDTAGTVEPAARVEPDGLALHGLQPGMPFDSVVATPFEWFDADEETMVAEVSLAGLDGHLEVRSCGTEIGSVIFDGTYWADSSENLSHRCDGDLEWRFGWTRCLPSDAPEVAARQDYQTLVDAFAVKYSVSAVSARDFERTNDGEQVGYHLEEAAVVEGGGELYAACAVDTKEWCVATVVLQEPCTQGI